MSVGIDVVMGNREMKGGRKEKWGEWCRLFWILMKLIEFFIFNS